MSQPHAQFGPLGIKALMNFSHMFNNINVRNNPLRLFKSKIWRTTLVQRNNFRIFKNLLFLILWTRVRRFSSSLSAPKITIKKADFPTSNRGWSPELHLRSNNAQVRLSNRKNLHPPSEVLSPSPESRETMQKLRTRHNFKKMGGPHLHHGSFMVRDKCRWNEVTSFFTDRPWHFWPTFPYRHTLVSWVPWSTQRASAYLLWMLQKKESRDAQDCYRVFRSANTKHTRCTKRR